MQKAIINCNVFSGDTILQDVVVVSEAGTITALQKEIPADIELIDAKGLNIAAGFIDIQINGGRQFYFSHSPTEETLHDICDSSFLYGTTYVLPCLISSPHQKILQAIEMVKNFMQQYPAKAVLGMHLEGPFINPEKRGAHNKDIIRKPTDAELDEIIGYGRDVIKVMTIAPEQFTNSQIEMLLNSGIILSAGHSMMTYQQAQYYFDKGIRLVTHLYNAMTQLGHRQPGMVGAIFNNDDVYAPIILDGAHCDYAAASIAYKIKKDKLFLISDAAFLGRQVTAFESDLLDAKLINGFYRNAEGNLAGAAISMAEAIENAIKYVGIPLKVAVQMATINAATAIGMQNKLGKIEKGYPAKFVCFNDDFSSYKTIIL